MNSLRVAIGILFPATGTYETVPVPVPGPVAVNESPTPSAASAPAAVKSVSPKVTMVNSVPEVIAVALTVTDPPAELP